MRANAIRGHAHATITLLHPHVGQVGGVEKAISHQEAIIDAADGVSRHLTAVEDVTPWWGSALVWAGAGAALWAVLLILGRLGVTSAAVGVMGWLWSLLSKIWRKE